MKIQEVKQKVLNEEKLRQLFRDYSDCYADTGRFENDGSYTDGEVIQAITEDTFVNISSIAFDEQPTLNDLIELRRKYPNNIEFGDAFNREINKLNK